MKAVTARQIQRLDELAIKKYGVPSIILMENAGAAVAREVLQDFKNKKPARVGVVCGCGNNGGDGFVVARHLLNAGTKVKIFLFGRAQDLKPDAKVNYAVLKSCGYAVQEIFQGGAELTKGIHKADLLVDALFGVGLNRDLAEPVQVLIQRLNQSGKPILAVDVPSGLDATTGKIYGACVKAYKTVTFTFAKKGFYLNAGPSHVGRVVVSDIGIPKKLLAG